MKKPLLLLIRGLPGSGKSYLASMLRRKIGEQNCTVLDPDATDYGSSEYLAMTQDLEAQGVDKKFYPYRFLRMQAHRAIEQEKIILWNQAFTNIDGMQKTIRNLSAHAFEHDLELQVVVVEVEIDESTAWQRIKSRVEAGGHDVPKEKFTRFAHEYRSFAGEEFDVLRVSGTDSIEESANKVLEKIK